MSFDMAASGAAPHLTSSNLGKIEQDLMMRKLHEQKIREKGFQTLHLGATKVLCPLTGPIKYWPYGQEVYITNMPSEMTEYELFTWFSQFGQILQLRLPLRKNGDSKMLAYVVYNSREEALNAVKKGNDIVFKYLRGSWKIRVNLSEDNRRIFVKNIPQTWTSDKIEQLVSSTCTGFKKVVLFKNQYCFLEFMSRCNASLAKRLLKHVLREKAGENTITVNWAYQEPIVDPEVMQKVKTLFIRGFSSEANQADVALALHNLLGLDWWAFRIRKEKDYAFVSFSTKSKAERAKKLLEGAYIHGEKISVCWARPSDPSVWIIPGVDAPSPRQCVTPTPNQRPIGYPPLDATGGKPEEARGGQTGWNHQSASVSEEMARCLRCCNLSETPFWTEQPEQLQDEPLIDVNYTPKCNWFKWSDGVDRVSDPVSATSLPTLPSSQDLQMGQNYSHPDAAFGMGFPDFSKWTNSTDAQLL